MWFANFAAHVLVAGVAYVWLSRRAAPGAPSTAEQATTLITVVPLTPHQQLTLGVITAWILGVVALNMNLGLSAFAAAAILLVARAADEGAAVRGVPWGIIMMVCGVSVLIAVLEKTGGMDLFTSLLARLASPSSINGVIAFVTGAISTYSSTSGVVLPAFLPTIPSLVERLGGGDPLAIALSINVGSSLVDVSPLSTIGALAVAAVANAEQSRVLFRQLMIWGLSMTIVGAIVCQLFAGFWREGERGPQPRSLTRDAEHGLVKRVTGRGSRGLHPGTESLGVSTRPAGRRSLAGSTGRARACGAAGRTPTQGVWQSAPP